MSDLSRIADKFKIKIVDCDLLLEQLNKCMFLNNRIHMTQREVLDKYCHKEYDKYIKFCK
jgi:hypothetical protein